MNCPKCGYAQDGRLDCIKCGIVFSKYYALHLPERTPSESPEPRVPLPPVPDMDSAGIIELRRTVQELSRRMLDVEFERAERNQIRSEIRGLDQTLRGLNLQLGTRMAELESRLTELESRLNDMKGPAAEAPIEVIKEQLWQEDLEPLMEKLEQLEANLDALQESHQSRQEDRQAAETVRLLDRRLAELETRMAGREKPADSEGRLAAAEQTLKELADLKAAVQTATVRYSEIGDLKKSNLILQNHVDSLRREFDSLRKEPSTGVTSKVAELQAETVALRAELQQSWKQLQALQATPQGNGVRELREEIAGLRKQRSDETQKLHQAVSGTSECIGSLSTQLQSMAGELQRVDRELASRQVDCRTLSDRLSSLETSSELPRPPLEEDVHAIREHLADIRRFIDVLQKVPAR